MCPLILFGFDSWFISRNDFNWGIAKVVYELELYLGREVLSIFTFVSKPYSFDSDRRDFFGRFSELNWFLC